MTALASIVIALVAAPRDARADAASDACFAAAVDGQQLRNAGRLIDARAKLLVCAATSCPREVSSDCTRWLADVNAALPTIVLGARDATGADLVDVETWVDGVRVGTTGDGRPVPLDPGAHRVRFVAKDGRTHEATVVARAGEKNRAIVASLAAPEPPRPAPTEAPPPSPSRSVPPATWILGGVGVVALGVFGVAGATGLSEYHRYGCDVGCAHDEKTDVDTRFLVADVSLVVGVVALAGAAWLFFTSGASSAPPPAAAHFDVRARRIWK